MQKASQMSTDASINFISSHLALSFKNQADNSQSSGQRYEDIEDRNGVLLPSTIPKSLPLLLQMKDQLLSLLRHLTKEYAVMSTRNECNAESRQLTVKPDEGLKYPTFPYLLSRAFLK